MISCGPSSILCLISQLKSAEYIIDYRKHIISVFSIEFVIWPVDGMQLEDLKGHCFYVTVARNKDDNEKEPLLIDK